MWRTGLVLAAGGGCLLLFLFLFVERRVLVRLAGLTREVDAVNGLGPTLGRMSVTGDDELGLLARRINAMAEKLLKSVLDGPPVTSTGTVEAARARENPRASPEYGTPVISAPSSLPRRIQ